MWTLKSIRNEEKEAPKTVFANLYQRREGEVEEEAAAAAAEPVKIKAKTQELVALGSVFVLFCIRRKLKSVPRIPLQGLGVGSVN